MSKTVYKYLLPLNNCEYRIPLVIPVNAKILDIDYQDLFICVWAEIDKDNKFEILTFIIYATGQSFIDLKEDEKHKYMKTIKTKNNEYVFHVYQIVKGK